MRYHPRFQVAVPFTLRAPSVNRSGRRYHRHSCSCSPKRQPLRQALSPSKCPGARRGWRRQALSREGRTGRVPRPECLRQALYRSPPALALLLVPSDNRSQSIAIQLSSRDLTTSIASTASDGRASHIRTRTFATLSSPFRELIRLPLVRGHGAARRRGRHRSARQSTPMQ